MSSIADDAMRHIAKELEFQIEIGHLQATIRELESALQSSREQIEAMSVDKRKMFDFCETQTTRYKKALIFYAKNENWIISMGYDGLVCPVQMDAGKIAKKSFE